MLSSSHRPTSGRSPITTTHSLGLAGLLLSFSLSFCHDFGRVFPQEFDAIFDTQVSVFIEKGRPITAWADSCNRLEGKRHKLPNSHLFAHQPSNCSLWRVGCLEIGPMPQSASQVHPPRPTDPIKTHRPLVVQPPPSRTLDRPWTGNTGPDHNTPPS